MTELPAGLSNLLILVYWLAGAALTLTIIIMVGSSLNRRRLVKKAWRDISADEAHEVQAQLIDAIKRKSKNEKTAVDITRFWKGMKISRYVRTALIDELLEAGIVSVAPKTYTNDFTQFFCGVWNNFFCLPPTVLILSDEDWLLMVNSKMTGEGILIERLEMTVDSHDVTHKSNNVIKTHGGSVSGVALGGRDANVSAGDIDLNSINNDVESFATLVRALRMDADLTTDTVLAARLTTHADLLEQDLNEVDSSESRRDVLSRVSGLIDKYGDAMGTTVRVIGKMIDN